METAIHLIETYGGNFRAVLEIASESDELKNRLAADLPHIEAEVVYAARAEMAATVEDFLSRRTRIALLRARSRALVRRAGGDFDGARVWMVERGSAESPGRFIFIDRIKYMLDTPFLEDRHSELAEQVARFAASSEGAFLRPKRRRAGARACQSAWRAKACSITRPPGRRTKAGSTCALSRSFASTFAMNPRSQI